MVMRIDSLFWVGLTVGVAVVSPFGCAGVLGIPDEDDVIVRPEAGAAGQAGAAGRGGGGQGGQGIAGSAGGTAGAGGDDPDDDDDDDV
jgi:hypothetical protein